MDIKIIGFIAAFCTTISFLPQVIKTWRTRSTKDISLPMYLILGLGLLLWTTYGFIIRDQAVIIANLVTFTLLLPIIFFKITTK